MSVSIHAQVVSGLIGLGAIAAGVFLPRRLIRRRNRRGRTVDVPDQGTAVRDQR